MFYESVESAAAADLNGKLNDFFLLEVQKDVTLAHTIGMRGWRVKNKYKFQLYSVHIVDAGVGLVWCIKWAVNVSQWIFCEWGEDSLFFKQHNRLNHFSPHKREEYKYKKRKRAFLDNKILFLIAGNTLQNQQSAQQSIGSRAERKCTRLMSHGVRATAHFSHTNLRKLEATTSELGGGKSNKKFNTQISSFTSWYLIAHLSRERERSLATMLTPPRESHCRHYNFHYPINVKWKDHLLVATLSRSTLARALVTPSTEFDWHTLEHAAWQGEN